MNRKISQFEVTTSFEDNDILTVVQEGTNKIIHKDDFQTSLSGTFATNERVDIIEDGVIDLGNKVDDNYTDLSNKIVEGDANVTKNVTGTMNEYYDVLNNTIITLEHKHDTDMSEMGGTMQEWIDDIDNRSTLDQLKNALNKITVLENLVTALAEQIASGGGSGSVPGFHTQGTNTIFPLTGYYYTGNTSALTTTDTLNQALSKLEGQIKSVEGSIGGDTKYVIKTGDNTQATDGNLYSALRSDENYLSAKSDDTGSGYIKFLKGIQGGATFREGFMGEGASLWPINGRWKMEVDDLFVRGQMTVNELIVNEIKATGGDILVSIADMKIIDVQKDAEGDYKCFFDNEDGTKYNQFRPGDQAICQIFDGKNVKRYWRLVKETGADYIILSDTVCEPGSAEPEVGDNVLQLGNRYPDGADRRSAIMISAKGSDGPNITMYDNIDDFTLVNKARTTIGKHSTFVGTISQIDGNGDIIRVPIDKGIYIPGTTYYYYDRVSYQGSLWLCMAISTTNPPSKENEEWLLQVEKGDTGAAGADKAKWVEIIGDRLFMYDNPTFEGTPKPEQLQLLCNIYNIESPIYEWKNRDTNIVLSTASSLIVRPEMFEADNRNMWIRCTVYNGEEIFYDEIQLAKLGDGAQGADAYYIDLSNGTVSVPFDSSGNTPLISLEDVYTDVYAYKGTSPVTIQNITATITNGIAEVGIENNRVKLTSLGTQNVRIQLNVQVDNILFTKVWYINKTNNGEDGFDGLDAAYVSLTGERVFKYAKDGTITPNRITLTATTSGIENVVYKWYWSVAGNNFWTLLENETTSRLLVAYDANYFANSDEITFKVVCTSEFGGVEYMDMLTVNKLYDGEDGVSPYRATLTNEAHTIASYWDGSTNSTELAKAKTNYALYQGTTELTTADYSIRYTNVDDNIQNQLNHDIATKTLSVTKLGKAFDSTVFKVEFCVPANSDTVIDVVDFTITKAKGGIPGDYELTIYCRSNESQPSTPTITTRPTANGVYNQGNYWYASAPASSGYAIWSSTALFDATTGQRKAGESWTVPTKKTGDKGEDGDSTKMVYRSYSKGSTPSTPTGSSVPPSGWSLSAPSPDLEFYDVWMSSATVQNGVAISSWSTPARLNGPAGPQGTPGMSGPGLNFVGNYATNTYYYRSNDLVDIVKYDGNYYGVARGRTYVRNVTPGTDENYWTPFNSFKNIATDLLFADEATIAGWQFSNSYIRSLNNEVCLNGSGAPDTPVIACGATAEHPGYYQGKINKNASLILYQSGIIQVGPLGGAAGISGTDLTDSGAVRFWAGSTYNGRKTARFRVHHNGDLYASNATISGNITANTGAIGGFAINNGRLQWSGSGGWGGTSKAVTIGSPRGSLDGVVDVSFDMATDGRYGIKSIGRAAGGACIYASSTYKSQSVNNSPTGDETWAGFFDGAIMATQYSTISGGTRWTGINFDNNVDLDNHRFTVRNGLIVELFRE